MSRLDEGASRLRRSAVITRYSRSMSCAVASTCQCFTRAADLYSARSATIGFTRVARRAGKYDDAAATALSNTATAP